MFYVFLNEDRKATAPPAPWTEALRGAPGQPQSTPLHSHIDPKNFFFFPNQNQEPGCAMPPPSAGPVRARASCVVIVAWRVPHPTTV